MKVAAPLTKLLVFAVVTTFVTVLLGRTIANTQGGDTVSYRAQFTDITGLLAGDDVRIAGVPAGRVTGTKVVNGKAEVTFKLRRDIPLTNAATARIRYRNLLGQRYISLSEGTGAGSPLRPGDLIPLSQTRSALDLTELFNGFRPIFETVRPEDVNRLAAEIIRTLEGEGGTIDTLLASTASLTNTLADRDAAIGRVVRNLTAVTETVAQRDATLDQFIREFQRLVTGLAGDRDAIGESLQAIDDVAAATAGLIDDARPSLDRTIANLDQLLAVAATKTPHLRTILAQLPTSLAALDRATSYGAWLNLYVLDVKLQIGNTVIPLPPPAPQAPARPAPAPQPARAGAR